jgi:hypothetical protein
VKKFSQPILSTKIISRAAVFSLIVILFASCESNSWFQSEDTLKAKIQKTWDMVRIPSTRPAEEWIFKEGKLMHFVYSGNSVDSAVANYSISTTYTKAFLTISDAPADHDAVYFLNAKWEIIELDGGLLFIATDYNGTTGLRQREFTER